MLRSRVKEDRGPQPSLSAVADRPMFQAPSDRVIGDKPVQRLGRRVVSAERGPEVRCEQTAARLGLDAVMDGAWADLDTGRWAGRCLDEIALTDAEALRHWMSDPHARDHGGESITDLVARVDVALGRDRPDGRTAVVTSPMVLRATVAAALCAPPATFFAVDVAPLDGLEISINGSRRAIRWLRPFPQWVEPGH